MKKIGKSILFVIIVSLVLFISYKLFFYYYAKNISDKVYANKDKEFVATITTADKQNNINSEVKYLKNENYLKLQRKIDNNMYLDETFQDLKNNTEVTILDNEKKQANMTIGNFFSGNIFNFLDYKFNEHYKDEKNILNKVNYFSIRVANGSPTIIKTVEYEGKEYYVLIYNYLGQFEEIYCIEKDTYLPFVYIDKTNLTTMTYDIEIRDVTDEEINYPELSQYYTTVVGEWHQ